MDLKGIIKKIIAYAVQVAEPEEIILFGSMANGTANAYSDIDLLIISDYCIDRREAISRIKNYAHGFAMKTDVLIRSTTELAKELVIPNSFVKAVNKSGIKVYKKADNILK